MIITINMPDEILSSLMKFAEREGYTLKQAIIVRCTPPEELLVDLTDQAIETKLKEWFNYAINELQDAEAFTLQQLAQLYEGRGVWTGYSVSTRKKLGKRFKALIDSIMVFDGLRLVPQGKTITNAALYIVREA